MLRLLASLTIAVIASAGLALSATETRPIGAHISEPEEIYLGACDTCHAARRP